MITLPKEKEQVLNQIKSEIKQSKDMMNSKRDEWKSRLRLYNNQRKQRDKIADVSLYSLMTTLLAMTYVDELTVSFEGRGLGDDKKAANKNDLAMFDNEEMNLPEINYFMQWDRLFFGVGIRFIGAWDKRRKVPMPKSFSPLVWLPDPAGYSDADSFRWHGIEDQLSKLEMSAEAGYEQAAVSRLTPHYKPDDGSQEARDAAAEAHGYDLPNNNETEVSEGLISVVHQFTKLDGVKWLITVDAACKEILRAVELKAVKTEEKLDKSLIPWGLVLNYYSPTRNDPCGVSVTDLVEDKVRAKSILANLRIYKEKAELYPMYLYNKNKIKNRRDLDFGFNKLIPISGDVGDNIVAPMAKDFNKASTLNQEESLDSQMQFATGASEMQQGVMSAQQRTLGEIHQVSVNSNIRHALGSKINAWGEKRFWTLWDRMYTEHFKGSMEKEIRITGGAGVRFRTLRKKDFTTKEDPDITIVSKLDSEFKKEKKRLAYSQFLPVLLQRPNTPMAAQNFALRKAAAFTGMEPDEIEFLIPRSPDEIAADLENEIMSRNEIPNVQEGDDHLTHLTIHIEAEDTPSKFAHMEAHRMAYMLSGQAAMDRQRAVEQSGGGTMRQASNIAMAQQGNQVSQMNNNPQELTPQ